VEMVRVADYFAKLRSRSTGQPWESWPTGHGMAWTTPYAPSGVAKSWRNQGGELSKSKRC